MEAKRAKGHPSLRCPYCKAFLDLRTIKLRDVKSFPCPTCHRFLRVTTQHTGFLIGASLLLSALALWAAGLRDLIFVAAIFPLSLLIFMLESAVLGYFVPLGVKPYEGSTREPSSHYATLDILKRVDKHNGATEPSRNDRAEQP